VIGAPDAAAGLRKAVLDQPLPARLLIPVTDTRALPQGHPAAGKPAQGPALFVCRGQTCSLPVTEPDAAREALRPRA
jgi:uncharacterized protein